MDKREYQNIFDNEETHFFYVSTHALVLQLIDKFSLKTKKLSLLDAGCGTGLLAKKLEKFGEIIGVDMHPEAIRLSKKRGISVRHASVTKLPFRTHTFDIVTCIDVLYHLNVTSDVTALKEFNRVLKPNGILILRVPANNWIKVAHDRHVHTRQRYGKSELREKLEAAGFIIKKLSFVHMSLFLPLITQHIKQSLTESKNSSSVNIVNPVVNVLLTRLLLLENLFLKNFNLPLGIGLIAVAQKPS